MYLFQDYIYVLIYKLLSFSDSFQVGDLVFAQKTGYIPWPSKLIEVSQGRQVGLVQFVYTNDYHTLSYRKLWPYNEQTKQQFVTKENLEYNEFAEAMWMAEKTSENELRFLHEVRQQRDTLHVEPLFIDQVNQLRRSLTVQQKHYPLAQLAFQRLLQLPLSQLLLIRNREAVESIRLLCRFVHHEATNPDEPELVRQLANRLMKQIAAHFDTANFWSQYCELCSIYMRHTVAIVKQS